MCPRGLGLVLESSGLGLGLGLVTKSSIITALHLPTPRQTHSSYMYFGYNYYNLWTDARFDGMICERYLQTAL